jgi:hypothetical protein
VTDLNGSEIIIDHVGVLDSCRGFRTTELDVSGRFRVTELDRLRSLGFFPRPGCCGTHFHSFAAHDWTRGMEEKRMVYDALVEIM